MRWAERQLAMLNEMGVRLWLPPPAPADEPASARAAQVAVDRAPAAVAMPIEHITLKGAGGNRRIDVTRIGALLKWEQEVVIAAGDALVVAA